MPAGDSPGSPKPRGCRFTPCSCSKDLTHLLEKGEKRTLCLPMRKGLEWPGPSLCLLCGQACIPESPRPSSGPGIHWKISQNSAKPLDSMSTVHPRERTQINVSSGKRHPGQHPGETTPECPDYSPSGVLWKASNPFRTMFDSAHQVGMLT